MKRSKLEGQRFGKWLVGEYVGKGMYSCTCVCGTVRDVHSNNLIAKKTTSCSCGHTVNRTRHGMTKTPEYRAWYRIKGYCYNKSDKRYKYYGLRGIGVCDRWLYSFENFYTDMGQRPAGHTFDRIDIDDDFSPENCRWVEIDDQRINRKKMITIGPNVNTMDGWCRVYNINQKIVDDRVKQLGWSYERAIMTPLGGVL